MTPKEAFETPKEKVLKELQEFHECFYDESKANTAELKRKRIEEYIEKSHKVLYEMHEENLVVNQKLEKALTRAKKEHELLGLYRSKDMHMEDYYAYGSLRGSQKALDNLRSVREEIEVLEEELEELE